MLPYNNDENSWLSKSKQKIIKHYKTYEDQYFYVVMIMFIFLLALALITSIDSFLE
jgi:hypothetical protein